MKYIIILAFLFFSFTIMSQTREVVLGANNSNYFNKGKSLRLQSEYASKLGAGAYFNFGDIELKEYNFHISVSLGLVQYNGEIEANNSGLGGGSKIVAEFSKTMGSLAIFPIKITIFEKNKFNYYLGFEYSRLLTEKYNGYYYSWKLSNGNQTVDLKNWREFSKKNQFSIQLKNNFQIPLIQNYYLCPQFLIAYNLNNEFISFPDETNSFYFFIGVGIGKELK